MAMDEVSLPLAYSGTTSSADGGASLPPCAPPPAVAAAKPNVEAGDLAYDHVPLRPAGRRQVRYRRIEPLRPRSFEYDEDEA
jgi:hypothetical protein